jgi:hypothetical protein
MTAVSPAGACLAVDLAPPYRPTAASPDAESLPFARPLWVGGYRARLVRYCASWRPVDGRELIRQVFVELPVGDGKVRDLVVGGAGVSRAELIRIVRNGLSSRAMS